MRGNRAGSRRGSSAGRSIPARAGEPYPWTKGLWLLRVYPRACGGTMAEADDEHDIRGLSPRVRGNHYYKNDCRNRLRSIPARAGEPYTGTLPSQWLRVYQPPLTAFCASRKGVYPRACGGTVPGVAGAVTGRGLSPRVRGNREHRRAAHERRGSIPARAGEPQAIPAGQRLPEVYPRACGGTGSNRIRIWQRVGLSPRVRGNRTGYGDFR